MTQYKAEEIVEALRKELMLEFNNSLSFSIYPEQKHFRLFNFSLCQFAGHTYILTYIYPYILCTKKCNWQGLKYKLNNNNQNSRESGEGWESLSWGFFTVGIPKSSCWSSVLLSVDLEKKILLSSCEYSDS